jgi:hypothetical protein
MTNTALLSDSLPSSTTKLNAVQISRAAKWSGLALSALASFFLTFDVV